MQMNPEGPEINITFRHSSSSNALKTHVQDKISKLGKYFIKPTNAHIILNVEGSRHTAEITLSENHSVFAANETSHDMYHSVDRAIDKLETQLKKYKEKIKNHHKKEENSNSEQAR